MKARHDRRDHVVDRVRNRGRPDCRCEQPRRIEKRGFLAYRDQADDEMLLLRQYPEIAKLMRFAGPKGAGDDDPFGLVLVAQSAAAELQCIEEFFLQRALGGFQEANSGGVGDARAQRFDRAAGRDVGHGGSAISVGSRLGRSPRTTSGVSGLSRP